MIILLGYKDVCDCYNNRVIVHSVLRYSLVYILIQAMYASLIYFDVV